MTDVVKNTNREDSETVGFVSERESEAFVLAVSVFKRLFEDGDLHSLSIFWGLLSPQETGEVIDEICVVSDGLDLENSLEQMQNKASIKEDAVAWFGCFNTHRGNGFEDTLNHLSEYGDLDLSRGYRKMRDLLLKRAAKYKAGRLLTRIKELSSMFGLTGFEIWLVKFLYCLNRIKSMDSAFDSFHDSYALSIIARCSRHDPFNFKDLVENRLDDLGLVDSRCDLWDCELTDSVLSYLDGFSNSPVDEKRFFLDQKPVYPLHSFPLSHDKRKLLRLLLSDREQTNIILYGEPGSGKTELARSLAHQYGKRVRRIGYGSEDKNDLKLALTHAKITAGPGDILIMDEADCLLNTLRSEDSVYKGIDKGWLNHFLETHGTKIIWITNETHWIEKSVRRRFNYTLEFETPGESERKKLWKMARQNFSLEKALNQNVISKWARKYPVNMGTVAVAAGVMQRVVQSSKVKSKDYLGITEEILNSHLGFVEREQKEQKRIKSTTFQMAGLNTDLDPQIAIDRIGAISKTRGQGINLLFHGIPGTGKTEFAHYIGSKLKKRVIVKACSDILSMWVGGTEKNIAGAFKEAQKSGAILLLDEIDSVLSSRASAQRSWERTQVNELLQQMDQNPGVLICTTNFMELLDHACLRRFHQKIKFNAMNAKGKATLFRQYFKKWNLKLTQQRLAALNDLHPLCPGDFGAVHRRIQWEENLNFQSILEELAKEVDYKEKETPKPGFVTG